MQEIKKQRHITEEMWINLENHTIQQEQFMQILEHTCECTWCADRLAAAMEPEDVQVMPPSYLATQILERTRQLDVQAAVTVKQTSKKMQLLLYSLRVGAAVAVSILILGVTANFRDISFTQMEKTLWEENRLQEKEETYQEKESILDIVNRTTNGVTEKMNEFTNQILSGGKER